MGSDGKSHFFAEAVVFQFALPHGERPYGFVVAAGIYGFNSRSRMGSDKIETVQLPWAEVSIRAPAWGATQFSPKWRRLRYVSIRAPAWGATWHTKSLYVIKQGFNSRSRMGSDTEANHNG